MDKRTALFWGTIVSAWLVMAMSFTTVDGESSVKLNPITEHTWQSYSETKKFVIPDITQREVRVDEKRKWAKLRAIMACESGSRFVATPVTGISGADLGHDVGPCQINTFYHGKRAASLGFNLWDPTQNMMYCIQLFEEQGELPQGRNPWDATRYCWEYKMSEYVVEDAQNTEKIK